MTDTFFTVFWLAWFGAFLIVEVIALLRKDAGDTLSEHVRRWFATERNPKGRLKALRRVVLLAALAWLAVHWMTDGSFI